VRLCLVHGFTQTGRSWAPIQSRLPDSVAPDLPGHGTKPDAATLTDTARILAREIGPAVWVGYSLGGRVCLHVATDHPEVVQGLVLISTSAGIDDPTERQARRHDDAALADTIEADGVPAFIDRWLAAPMWASLPRDNAGIDARLANSARGLAGSLRLSGAGTQEPLWDRLAEIEKPTLVMTGDLDAKYTAIGARLTAALDADRVRFAGTGHALPWERPDTFAATLRAWLTTRGPTQGPHRW
jgi:2-succinyl-6-hydroxy-2,4-cyclohexadiene-1-carboxylate synthase